MSTPTRVLPALVLAQLLGTSPWFAVNAVMPDLQLAHGWPAAQVGTLTSAVQAGFILGTLVFAVLAVADRFSARRVFLLCALASAGCTLAAAASVPSFGALWGWRAATGFFLAGIYPVGMKIASQWFPKGLGTALGLLVGALVLGTASPHALRALGAQWPWAWVFGGVAVASVAGGLLVLLAIPEPPRRPAARGAGLHLRDATITQLVVVDRAGEVIGKGVVHAQCRRHRCDRAAGFEAVATEAGSVGSERRHGVAGECAGAGEGVEAGSGLDGGVGGNGGVRHAGAGRSHEGS